MRLYEILLIGSNLVLLVVLLFMRNRKNQPRCRPCGCLRSPSLPQNHRGLMVRVWYPAKPQPGKGEKKPWRFMPPGLAAF
ncbi:hypothetical protein SAMN02799616_04499 [Paenibacillus sp. UNC499MF]|nr:hypothetical protein SAMN02799616_04499 [Paenibacillus sp. UNC499MF]